MGDILFIACSGVYSLYRNNYSPYLPPSWKQSRSFPLFPVHTTNLPKVRLSRPLKAQKKVEFYIINKLLYVCFFFTVWHGHIVLKKMSRNNLNTVNVENSNWRKVVMPKKMHFIWKTNVSQINNCGLLRSFREITALGISTPSFGFHPGYQTWSFPQLLWSF